jgi:[NiFe] hydrogenase assembly HybE family chaperone
MDDRIQNLVAAHRRISEERMRGLPIFNERLDVEAVGFRSADGRPLGVLISPWFLNLVLLPGPDDDWSDVRVGSPCVWEFPAGQYEFHAAELPGVGTHYTAALFSTVADFPDQATARAVAEGVMERLFSKTLSRNPETVRRGSGDVLFDRSMSRRGLLRRVMLMPD